MWEELTKIEICEIIWWIIKILCFWYPSPMGKSQKIENESWYVLINVENNFWRTPLYIRKIVYWAKIVRALSSNKIVFCIFAKIQ